jgi:potassium/hydrogen antiporter
LPCFTLHPPLHALLLAAAEGGGSSELVQGIDLAFPVTLGAVGLLMIASVVVEKYALRLGVPSAVALFGIGLAVNVEALKIDIHKFEEIHILALCVMLFYSGVTISRSIYRCRKLFLSTLAFSLVGTGIMVFLGTVINWGVLELLVPDYSIRQFQWLPPLAIAYAMAAQDWGAFSFVSKRIRSFNLNVRSVFELESAVSAAMTLVLGACMVEFLATRNTVEAVRAVAQVAIGGVAFGLLIGSLFGACLAYAIRRFTIEHAQLSVIAIGFVFLGYAVSDLFSSGGLICSLVMGVVVSLLLNREEDQDEREVLSVQLESINIATEALIFFLVGLSIAPQQFFLTLPVGFAVLAGIWLIRPLNVWLFYSGGVLNQRERVMLASWNPKGAVTMALALTIPELVRLGGIDFQTLVGKIDPEIVLSVVCGAVILSMLIKSLIVPAIHHRILPGDSSTV